MDNDCAGHIAKRLYKKVYVLMPKKHPFIFEPGFWLGEGKISLSMMDEKLPFYTRWTVPSADDKGLIACLQEIQIAGLSDMMHNQFSFYDVSRQNFAIKLENQSIGKVVGKGIINSKLIGWEFRLGQLGFEGFEFYEVAKEPDTYLLHAEYAASDDFRTVIHGKIWKKAPEQKKEATE